MTISLVELLANPKAHVGKRVGISGFYHTELESAALYLTRADEKYGNHLNGVWIYPPARRDLDRSLEIFNNKFITVHGIVTCDPNGEGHLGTFRIGIREVDKVEMLPGQVVAPK